MESEPKWVRWEDSQARRSTTPERREAARRSLEAEIAAYRLAEIRRAQHRTQAQIAEIMGVGQRRVSDIESAELLRTEVSTIDSYVTALGGRLRLVADFGDHVIPLH
ncbi:helix-turn-helix domain-containing protein [Jiangella rhizosphaerae]|uniref:Helix-turn-helix domain-containing protein n=1 Tax=Jiangella rhizosphaerae TaxID=2293569 RepID=A0A418KS92_9ACTN|nr:helix-turn-helix domain-containing protein [Jiangella rhizosphaerae]RIQ26056.1 helix-turn-helix domain-containing protein [Jiangella rhizosphaerae]